MYINHATFEVTLKQKLGENWKQRESPHCMQGELLIQILSDGSLTDWKHCPEQVGISVKYSFINWYKISFLSIYNIEGNK